MGMVGLLGEEVGGGGLIFLFIFLLLFCLVILLLLILTLSIEEPTLPLLNPIKYTLLHLTLRTPIHTPTITKPTYPTSIPFFLRQKPGKRPIILQTGRGDINVNPRPEETALCVGEGPHAELWLLEVQAEVQLYLVGLVQLLGGEAGRGWGDERVGLGLLS